MLVGTMKPAKVYPILRSCCTPASSTEALRACPFIKNTGVATMDWELQGSEGRLVFYFWFVSSLIEH